MGDHKTRPSTEPMKEKHLGGGDGDGPTRDTLVICFFLEMTWLVQVQGSRRKLERRMQIPIPIPLRLFVFVEREITWPNVCVDGQ